MTGTRQAPFLAFAPLSEDHLVLPNGGHEIIAAEHGERAWQDVLTLSRGEQRHLNFDFRVPAGYRGSMLRVIRVPAGARLSLGVKLRVGADADWSSIIIVQGSGEVVVQRQVTAIGSGAKVRLATVGLLDGQAQLQVDDDIYCESSGVAVTLRTHTVLHDAARSDVRGRVVLSSRTGGSEIDQSLCHLLLGDLVRGRAIPELDIAEQNVNCRHRSFIGRPKDSERFFLQSRGLSDEQANQLLAHGFLSTAFRNMPMEIVTKALHELHLGV